MSCAFNDTDVESMGEPKAHAAIARKYNARFRCVCGPCQRPLLAPGVAAGGRTYFVLEEVRRPDSGGAIGSEHGLPSANVGAAAGDSGFHILANEAAQWMRIARTCALARRYHGRG